MKTTWIACVALLALATPAAAEPVLMISIDGLRPLDVIDAEARGIQVPNLRRLMAQGAYATGVRGSLPTLTRPSHLTLITGVWPARHGITDNDAFDPLGRNRTGWYWYADDVKVPTLWDAVHAAGGTTASISWPASVGSRSITYNFPDYPRGHDRSDPRLVQELGGTASDEAIDRTLGFDVGQRIGAAPDSDLAKAAFAAAIYALEKPQFFTIHLGELDEAQHGFGPGSAEARKALTRMDAAVGMLIDAARRVEPDLVVVVASDHGFADYAQRFNLVRAFAEAGLLTLDPVSHRITDWKAAPWGAASAMVMLADPRDKVVKAKTRALLDRLAADPANGINRVADADEIARMGGMPGASFWVDFRIGYIAGGDPAGPMLQAPNGKGAHGYFPEHPEMRSSFFAAGPGVPKSGAIGEIDQRAIAPTVAKLLHVALPTAEGRPLF